MFRNKKQREAQRNREAKNRKQEQSSNSLPKFDELQPVTISALPIISSQPKDSSEKKTFLAKLWRNYVVPFFKKFTGLVLLGGSYTMIQINEFALAGIFVIFSLIAFVVQIYEWNGISEKPKTTKCLKWVLFLIAFIVAIYFGGVVYNSKGEKAWSTWLYKHPQPIPIQTKTEQLKPDSTKQSSDEKLAAIEFNSEATKKLQALFFKIELKRPYLLNELGYFRLYFEFVNVEKVEIRAGCQGKFDKNGRYLVFNRSWLDGQNVKHPGKSYSTVAQGGNTLDVLHCWVDTSKEKFPYQTTNDLEKRQVKIYATDSLVKKIKSISLVAENYKILSNDADKFVINYQDPGIKWFVPLSDSEKAIQWQMIALQDTSEKVTKMLEPARERKGDYLVWAWYIDFAEFPPTKMPRYFQ